MRCSIVMCCGGHTSTTEKIVDAIAESCNDALLCLNREADSYFFNNRWDNNIKPTKPQCLSSRPINAPVPGRNY